MSLAATLLPVTILAPLGVAMLLIILARSLPPQVSTLIAVVAAAAVTAISFWLARQTMHGPVLHWLGGWTPAASGRPGVILGISLMADPASAAVAAFCGLIFVAAMIFAWGYFDEVHSHFEILMLLFLAGMVGFCFTHDLFDLFVWFELMSTVAFALTAYPLGRSSLEGAFNFTITNALASFMMLAAVGLLYARTGTLDFTQMNEDIGRQGSDPALVCGFCLLSAALLTKAAIAPFHMWLSDAHAVAPSPVSVVFSGVMVSVALFVLAKLISQIFSHGDATPLRFALLWLGAVTAAVGGLMAWSQRHLKRLLAFSTIAHMGIMLTGIATTTPTALAGFLLYIVGHGLIKGALFMIAGILLALRASGDEIMLYGKGRSLWPAGSAMAAGGLLLGGLPIGILHGATELIQTATTRAASLVILVATALTGAAVLRAAARIFLRWSGAPGLEFSAPTEREHEKGGRPLWLMLPPCLFMLALALIPGRSVDSFLAVATGWLAHPDSYHAITLPKPKLSAASFDSIALTFAILGLSLCRERATSAWARRLFRAEALPVDALQSLHSGLIGDYVVWMMLGLALLTGFFGLRQFGF